MPDSSVVSAWKLETSPGPVLRVTFPRSTVMEVRRPVIGWNRSHTVMNRTPTISQSTIRDRPPKTGSSKNPTASITLSGGR